MPVEPVISVIQGSDITIVHGPDISALDDPVRGAVGVADYAVVAVAVTGDLGPLELAAGIVELKIKR